MSYGKEFAPWRTPPHTELQGILDFRRRFWAIRAHVTARNEIRSHRVMARNSSPTANASRYEACAVRRRMPPLWESRPPSGESNSPFGRGILPTANARNCHSSVPFGGTFAVWREVLAIWRESFAVGRGIFASGEEFSPTENARLPS